MRLQRYLLPTALTASFVLAFVLVPDAMAQNFGLDAAADKAKLSKREVTDVIASILKTALSFVGTVFLLLMLYAGFLYLTARGDAKKVDSAKQMIVGAIIGIIIIASAYAITDLVLKAATGTGDGSAEVADIPDGTVSSGGSCGSTADCVEPLICNGGVCKTTNFGSCVPGKACEQDSDCSSNGGCFDKVCSCDAI